MEAKADTQTQTATGLGFGEFPSMIRGKALEQKNIFCILDAAADEKLYPLLKNSDWEYRCLYKKGVHYEGERMVDALAATAPYLLRLDPDRVEIEQFLSSRLGKNRLILIRAKTPIQELTEHFSGILKAADEEGNIFNFRYFDPRILRVYLPTCTEEEKRIVYGPVEILWAEGEEGAMLEFPKKAEAAPAVEAARPEESKPEDEKKGYGIFNERKEAIGRKEEPLTGYGMIGEFSRCDGSLQIEGDIC